MRSHANGGSPETIPRKVVFLSCYRWLRISRLKPHTWREELILARDIDSCSDTGGISIFRHRDGHHGSNREGPASSRPLAATILEGFFERKHACHTSRYILANAMTHQSTKACTPHEIHNFAIAYSSMNSAGCVQRLVFFNLPSAVYGVMSLRKTPTLECPILNSRCRIDAQ